MSFKSKFLTLPIKNQIYIAIITLNLFCISVILSIFGSLAYQILKEDLNQKRLYFYEKYKEYIESCFYLQNFCLLQYEELIKRIQLQMREIFEVAIIYNYTYNINMDIMNKFIIYDLNQEYNIDAFKQENNDYLYYNCLSTDNLCSYIQETIMNQYNALSSLVFSHNINKKFNIPMFDNIAIMSDPIFYEILSYSVFSFNFPKLLKQLKEIFGNKSNVMLLNDYLNIKINDFLEEINENIDLILINPYPLIELYFNKTINHLKQETPDYLDLYQNNIIFALSKMSSYFTKIDYANNQFNLIYLNNDIFIFLYIESNLIDNYLYFMNNKLSSFIDLYFIPLYYENNTIISPDLSILFLLKQMGFKITQKEEVDKLYEKIIKGKSKIHDCIKDFELLDYKLEINDIFNLNNSNFMSISNSSINQGILKIDNTNYYYMKYSYPNFNTLIEFKPEFFYMSQINFYAFCSLKELLKYSSLLLQISSNCFNLFILIIVYIWFFCLLTNSIIFIKVNKQLIKPIKKLQEALLSDSIKDAKIFEYEYDDIINELFLTCKEFLCGKIDKDNKEKGLDNLSNLSIVKEKSNTEENKYTKNLKINNDLMNKLINEQNILMDFSKYIEINENNILENNGDENSNNSTLFNKKMKDSNNKLGKNILKKVSFKFQKEEKEKENREYFKKLFQISEYFYFFLKQNKQQYIKINDNEINDESNINKKTEQSSQINSVQEMPNNKTVMKNSDSKLLNKDIPKSVSINIINKNDMTYLWYMEAKNRNNKSLNYKIGKNYDELFNDVNNFENY